MGEKSRTALRRQLHSAIVESPQGLWMNRRPGLVCDQEDWVTIESRGTTGSQIRAVSCVCV